MGTVARIIKRKTF